MEHQAASALQLTLNEGDKRLHVAYTPAEGAGPPDRATLEAALAARGWAQARLDEPAIARFLLAAHRADGPIDAAIGELADGYFELEIDPDELVVRLTLWPPEGGKPVEPLDVRTALATRNIRLPVDEAALAEAFAAGRCADLPIVLGMPPTRGTPARFDNLLEPRRAGADDRERIDLRDLGSLLLVQPGTPLMRRTPALQGKAGQDVYGRVLPAPELDDSPFSDRLTGVETDPNDPNLLIAAVAGLPSVRRRGVSVNPVVNVEAVDMHSGNIAFDGTLKVNGDIKTGMSVKVAGDVIVQGTIEAAHVEAGGNVIVHGGIIGKIEGGPNDPTQNLARIQCKGSLQARFIEGAVVEAHGAVTVESGIRHSDVAAAETISAGDPAHGTGNITGGRCRAWQAVRTGTVGAPAGIGTAIQVGLNPYADAEKAALESDREKRQQEQDKVQQLLAFFAKHPERATPELREKARATLFKYTKDILDLDGELAKLAEQLHPRPDAAVVVGKRLHGGVTITIGQKTMRVMEDMPGAELRLIGDAITVV